MCFLLYFGPFVYLHREQFRSHSCKFVGPFVSNRAYLKEGGMCRNPQMPISSIQKTRGEEHHLRALTLPYLCRRNCRVTKNVSIFHASTLGSSLAFNSISRPVTLSQTSRTSSTTVSKWEVASYERVMKMLSAWPVDVGIYNGETETNLNGLVCVEFMPLHRIWMLLTCQRQVQGA